MKKRIERTLVKYRGLKKPIEVLRLQRNLLELQSNIDLKFINSNDIKKWKKSFSKFLLAQPEQFEIVNEFYNNNLELINNSFKNEKDKVTLICIVKNDLLKVKESLKHHRSIGVEQFVFIDNLSDDGTREWLLKQGDVHLYSAKVPYTTDRREAWINKIISFYGFNRWYLILDSDELFSYVGEEKFSIVSFIEFLEKEKIYRSRSLMIDMYAKREFYNTDNDDEYIKECCYFDTDSYIKEESLFLNLVTGGPRDRIFNSKSWITKFPLIYFQEGDIQGNSHYPFPYQKNFNSLCYSYLKHYKFLPKDIEKYREIAENNNYFNGSTEYKKYISIIDNKTGSLDFINERSKEMKSSIDVLEIENISKGDLKK